MGWIDFLGFAGAAASLVAFAAKTMIPLRIAAIVGNVFFLAYGLLGYLWPSILLNLILLPLNVHRLIGMQRLVRKIEAASASQVFNADWLRPYMKQRTFAAGKTIFAKGDAADAVYYIVTGDVLFPERGGRAGPGSLFGEIGIFTPEQRRTLSCVCETDVVTLYLTLDELKQLYFQNPEFGFQLMQLIVGRLAGQVEALERHVDQNPPARTA